LARKFRPKIICADAFPAYVQVSPNPLIAPTIMGTTYQTRVAVMQGVNRRRQLHASDKKTFSRDAASLAATFPIAPQENYSVPQKFFDAPRKLPVVSQFCWIAPQNSRTAPQNDLTVPQSCRTIAQIISVVPHNLPDIPRKCRPAPQICRNAAQLLQGADNKLFTTAKRFRSVKLISLTPHPDPLPWGEGTASDDFLFSKTRPANPAPLPIQDAGNVSPSPRGRRPG
jgi:hypothetical protein